MCLQQEAIGIQEMVSGKEIRTGLRQGLLHTDTLSFLPGDIFTISKRLLQFLKGSPAMCFPC